MCVLQTNAFYFKIAVLLFGMTFVICQLKQFSVSQFLIIPEGEGGHVILAISPELASVHISTPYRSD
jgi:hypothetical protein